LISYPARGISFRTTTIWDVERDAAAGFPTEAGTMAPRLEQIFEYRVLLSRARELGIPLSLEEQARLDRLGRQLPTGVPPLDERDPHTRLAAPLAAEFVQAGRFQVCTLCNASSDGFALATADPPVLGQPLLVQVRGLRDATEYTFPARVVSRVVRGVSGMSVAFEGLPTERGLMGRSSSGVWPAEDVTTAVQALPDANKERHSIR
jgi:hypothetical protein